MAGYEVGSAFLTILPSAKGFGSSLSGELDGPFQAAGQRGGTQIGTGVSKGGKGSFLAAGGAMGAVFAAAFVAAGGVAVIKAAANYLAGAVTAASDMNETISKTKQIFGDATDAVVAFTKDSKKNILLTQQQALDGAATFGIFGKSAGLAGEDLSGFSTGMVSLASDLASFNNTSTEDAIGAIGSALRGEAEPIRAYGVLLDDATLKNQALAMGLITTTKDALTPQQKVLAAHAEILKQTSLQQGDAERTAGGFANQQKILKKTMEDTKVEIGTALLPVVTDLLRVFADEGVPKLQALAAWFTENKDAIAAFALAAVDGSLSIIQAFLGLAANYVEMQGFFLGVGQAMVNAWFVVVGSFIDGAVKMFGWVPGVGPKLLEVQAGFTQVKDVADASFTLARESADKMSAGMDDAAGAVGGLRDAIQKIDGMNVTAKINVDTGQLTNGGLLYTQPKPRATGGPVRAGSSYMVGEREPELFVPDRNGQIYNQKQLAGMGGGSSGSGITQNIYPSAGLDERLIGDISARQMSFAMRGVA